MRRLRALVNAYRDALAPAAHEFLSRELRWLQQELNPARDWDVFIATTLEPITRRMPGLEACLAAAQELRDLAQGRATATLAAPRYTAFLLHCYHWLATGAWALADTGLHDRPVAEFAAAMLQRRHRRLLKFGGKRADLPEADLHRLRLMAKKQRYIGDFFREIYPRKATGRYIRIGRIRRCWAPQRCDGEPPCQKSSSAIWRMSLGRSPQAAQAAGVILGWQGGRIAEDLNRVSTVWKAFTKHKTFWPRPEEPIA